ncbi:hypothetical protein FNV43_RR19000 [Rhamnella rubrinervis]|uniref:BHLH domain-containing protein n=1 Tax=Rhamnella rubrinervis TaxID=2594499 RepID=A0A8K0E721_9ROSA|nr:hypothetical protein FNV43_RR19000 [Rhamnella rubrinervis]
MECYENLHSQQYQLQEQAVACTTLPTLHTTVDSIWPNSNSEVVYSNSTGTSTFGGFSSTRYDHFSDAFPTSSTNYGTASDSVLCSSSSLGLNLHGLDLLPSNLQTSNQSSSHVNLGLSNKHSASLGNDQDVQESRDSPSSNSSNITTGFINEVSRTKRSNSGFSEPKVSQASAKKSRTPLRSSNPPLKIRKEKLGDRIAALHRLVAPFGKTDTASVLTEAIGYIQFLHDQVQTLSVPYMMKSLNNKPSGKMQQVLSRDEETETKLDLRSRGLCLVPESYVSYFSGYD